MSFLGRTVARVTTDTRYSHAGRVPSYGRTLSGLRVDPDNVVTLAAVWACLRYLSQSTAVLPWHVMRDTKVGADVQTRHPIDWLLWKRPSPEWSSFQFRETLTHWAARWGNGYAEIEPTAAGLPAAMHPIHPERVMCCRADSDSYDNYETPIRAGQLYYEIDGNLTQKILLASSRMFHVRGFGESPCGVNVISYAAESLGWARAAQLFGAAFFGNGLNPAGVVINKTPLKPDGLKKQKAEFDALYKGPRNANRTAHIDAGADWKPISFNAREAQLIDVHQHLVEEVCRWFGVPPHKIMHLLRATFSNIESQAIEVVVDSITPWVKRFEDEADYKLFGQNRSSNYTKMNMRGLMRGDVAARIAYYEGMTKIGAYSPNRVLECEDENTLGPEGDIHTMQSQNVTLEQIANGTANDAGGAPASEKEQISTGLAAIRSRLGVIHAQ